MANSEGTAVITATNLANWIPIVWSKDVLAATQNSMVLGNLFDRSYEQWARNGGNKIVVPNLANLTAAAVNTSAHTAMYDAVQNVTNIDINKKYDVGVVVDDINQLQTNPKYYEKVRSKLVYALAKQIDTNCATQFLNYDNAVGVTGSALTEDALISAYEYLNTNNAPFEERAWVFNPESITDLLKLDYFVRMDYVPDSVVKQGFQGRQIFGSPVYISTNLDRYGTTSEHQSGYFHREATALVIQMDPKFETFRIPQQHSDGITGLCVFGIQEMRGTWGVLINCRA